MGWSPSNAGEIHLIQDTPAARWERITHLYKTTMDYKQIRVRKAFAIAAVCLSKNKWQI